MKPFKPKISLIVIILFLIFTGVFYFNGRGRFFSPTSPEVNGPSPVPSSSDAKALAANVEYYDGSTNAPSSGASATPVPKPPVLTVYTYPGAFVKSSSSTKLELESSDSPEKITEWYKNKIRDLMFNAKSFTQTSTNGDVLNKLTAAKPGEKIEITIKKYQNESKVIIAVDRP